MNKKLVIAIVGIVIILWLSITVASKRKNNTEPELVNNSNGLSSVVFFYGNTCPNCKKVEQFIKDNNLEEKITITKKEIYDNRENALEFSKAANLCGLSRNYIVVPFLLVGKKCYSGISNTLNYLSEKI